MIRDLVGKIPNLSGIGQDARRQWGHSLRDYSRKTFYDEAIRGYEILRAAGRNARLNLVLGLS